jgi:hypothetical protein
MEINHQNGLHGIDLDHVSKKMEYIWLMRQIQLDAENEQNLW